ncbi:MAG TPA: hypothetical protein VMF50_14220 [Candidatus Binataceae bacterium]|nr:hypothetical protein [Candidatus Binataceae bacterium]
MALAILYPRLDWHFDSSQNELRLLLLLVAAMRWLRNAILGSRFFALFPGFATFFWSVRHIPVIARTSRTMFDGLLELREGSLLSEQGNECRTD